MSNKPIAIKKEVRRDISAKQNDGFQKEEADRRDFNQAIYQSEADYIWASQSEVIAGTANMYTDGSGIPKDIDTATIVIEDDDKILIKHSTTQTANLLLNAGGKTITVEMYGGVTLDMDTFDLTLGSTGDNIKGDIRVIGTGTITIEESAGLRIDTNITNITTVQGGDKTINNVQEKALSANIDAKDLVATWLSTSTVGVKARSLKLVDTNNQSNVYNDVDEIFNTATDLNSLPQLADTWYDIQFGGDKLGNLEKKLTPVLEGTTDGTTAFELVISTFNFDTHKVRIGDLVFNTTDGTDAKVTGIANAATGRLLLDKDIFVSGESYRVELQSPDFSSGFDFIGNVGEMYVDSGNNIDPSLIKYVGQKFDRSYSAANGDFTITNSVGAVNFSSAVPMLIDKSWWLLFQFKLTRSSSSSSFGPIVSGVTSVAVEQAISVSHPNTAADVRRQTWDASSGELVGVLGTGTTVWSFSGFIQLESKPTWAD